MQETNELRNSLHLLSTGLHRAKKVSFVSPFLTSNWQWLSIFQHRIWKKCLKNVHTQFVIPWKQSTALYSRSLKCQPNWTAFRIWVPLWGEKKVSALESRFSQKSFLWTATSRRFFKRISCMKFREEKMLSIESASRSRQQSMTRYPKSSSRSELWEKICLEQLAR